MSVRGQTTSRHFVAFRDRPKVTTFVAFGSVPKLHFLSLLGQVENNFQDIFILYENVVGDNSVALFVNLQISTKTVVKNKKIMYYIKNNFVQT